MIIYAKPGNTITINLFVIDSGVLTDSLTDPIIKNLYLPSKLADGYYPVNMDRIDDGIYSYEYNILNNPTSVGDFIFDIEYTDPETSELRNKLYQLIVLPPFGLNGGNSINLL